MLRCDEFGRPLSGPVQHHLGRALRAHYERQPAPANARIDELLRRLAQAEEAAEDAAEDAAEAAEKTSDEGAHGLTGEAARRRGAAERS